MIGKTWSIPEDAKRPLREKIEKSSSCTLLSVLKDEMKDKVSRGIYHKIQIELTYNSNHIEGSKLTHDQTRYIYETNTIGVESNSVNVDEKDKEQVIKHVSQYYKCYEIGTIKCGENKVQFINRLNWL